MNRLIGYTLGDAFKLAREKGFEIGEITITSPPKMEILEYDDSFRVLRVNTSENKLNILVCKPL
ncbi:hypothetical protein [Ruminiclostridium cellobioparum]|jgi:hypothetical protein|uniref:hypothetical protein n=1 Tax=Ruminiclostridium cellobioparum TaxID=29355 RepID=UPI0028A7C6BF|nr:hypothetical protein [Ruminiclostridium cellobioparum]